MWRILTFAACLILGPGLAGAATVEHLSPKELADRSEMIFIGQVSQVDVTFEREPTRVWTTVSFAVETVIKGEPRTRAVFRQLGGTVSTENGPLTQTIHGYPSFQVGERVLMFLERADTGVLVVTGLAQGKFKLTPGDDPKTVVAQRNLKDIRYPRPLSPVRTLAGHPSPGGTLYLDQLLDQIAGRQPVARPVKLRFRTPEGLPTPRSSEGGSDDAPSRFFVCVLVGLASTAEAFDWTERNGGWVRGNLCRTK